MNGILARLLPVALPALCLLAAPATGLQGAAAQVAVFVPGGEPTGWIGVSVEMRGTVESGTGDRDSRVVITEVRPDGPAARAGLRAGDLLVSLNGRAPQDGFGDMLRALAPGDPVEAVVRREGTERRFRFTAGTRPAGVSGASTYSVLVRADTLADRMYRAMDSLRIRIATGELPDRAPRLERLSATGFVVPDTLLPPDGEGRPFHLLFLRRDGAGPEPVVAPGSGMPARPGFPGAAEAPAVTLRPLAPYALGQNRAAGAEVVELKPELASYFGVERGVLVVDVAPGTPADDAGLLPGDVLVGLGAVAVGSVAEFRKGLAQPRDSLVVRYIRKGETREGLLRR